jgi:DNA-binding CsgD family transcriptional regulator
MPGWGEAEERVSVVLGVDGAGRTHRLTAIADASTSPVLRLDPARLQISTLDAQLEVARQDLVLVDDAHRIPDEGLTRLAEAARSGTRMTLARRPRIDRPELAELDEAVAAQGEVEVLAALSLEQVRELVTGVTGRPCPPAVAVVVRESSGGLPAIAVAIATGLAAGAAGSGTGPLPAPGPQGLPPLPGLLARLQRRIAVLPAAVTALAEVLALRLDLSDDALAAACGLNLADLDAALHRLRDEGLLVPAAEEMVPAVAQTLLAQLAPGRRRRVHDDVARALVSTGAAAVPAALQLRAARARGSEAAAAYLAAGEDVRFSDPGAALGWYDDAQDAGAPTAAVAAGRAEANALLGMSVDPDGAESGELHERDAARLTLVSGAVAAYQGRADRAGTALLATGPPGPALATPALVAAGRLKQAEVAAKSTAPNALRLLAEAVITCPDPAQALPLLIEAAEAVESTPATLVLLDTPHALGAVLAVTTGDVATAGHLLETALRRQVGGPVSEDRHRLLLAWARMRAGNLEPARAQVQRLAGAELGGRDRVLYAAVQAGVARRSGDIATLREAWPSVERVFARRSLDLFQLEPAEELAVAAARLRRTQRSAAALVALEEIVEGLGSPPTWVITLGWLHLQVAVASDDPAAARGAADRIAAATSTGAGATAAAVAVGPRQLAQQAAAGPWARALAGDVDTEAVIAASDLLAAAELPWEASRLAGDAAIRVSGAAAARRLLERARDLAAPEPAAAVRTVDPAAAAGLSEREVEVSRLVLAGRTHREIGAQLFIAPKTVEHHVARIRTKLGATTRAEFVAALHSVLDDAGGSVPSTPP